MSERVTHDDAGEIDEVVTDGGAHLERLGESDWWLSCVRADGSSVCLWIEGRVVMTEDRPAAECTACGFRFGARPVVTDGGYLICGTCGWTADPSWSRAVTA